MVVNDQDILNESAIIKSWKANGKAWTKVITNNEIKSRIIVTNNSIINAILARKPHTILDIGCGEGWLTRELLKRGINATGVDATESLIENAKAVGPGDFLVSNYENLRLTLQHRKFDMAVCNFSLFGKHSVSELFRVAPKLLNPNGWLVVQTVHPENFPNPQQEGWRESSWEGFSSDFVKPAPWFFRTKQSWCQLFEDNDFQIREITEPGADYAGKPLSLILSGKT